MLGSGLTERLKTFSAIASLRNLWLALPGDIVISSTLIPDYFVNYIANTLGFPSSFVKIINSSGKDIDDEFLLDGETFRIIKNLMDNNIEYRANPCFPTEGIAFLEKKLDLYKSDIGNKFFLQNGNTLLNRKSHFRQIGNSIDLPIANGHVANSKAMIKSSILELIKETDNVILKKNNGAGGDGNIILTKNIVKAFDGANVVLFFKEDEIDEITNEVWGKLIDNDNTTIVIETYYEAKYIFYLEYYISDEEILFLNSGSIINSLKGEKFKWIGLDIPSNLPDALFIEAKRKSDFFFASIKNMGYRGYINIDAIQTIDSNLIFNEVNGRWGGGTVLDSIANRLIGSDYSKTHIISSFREIPSHSVESSIKTLEREGVSYDKTLGYGVIILSQDSEKKEMEVAIISKSRGQKKTLEGKLKSLFFL